MKTLFLSTNYTTDSNLLFSAATKLGYKTRRLLHTELNQIKQNIDKGEETYVYMGWLWADLVAGQGIDFMSPEDDYLLQLPNIYTKREIGITTTEKAPRDKTFFYKPLEGKAFDGQILDGSGLDNILDTYGDMSLIYSEVVNMVGEHRFFIQGDSVVASSYYRGEDTGHQGAADLAMEVAPFSKAENYVVDIALLDTGEYCVVEANPIHQSSLYKANAERVLPCLRVW